MLEATFNKEKAERFMRTFKEGKSIEPSEQGRWELADVITLAGVCHFVVGYSASRGRSRWRESQGQLAPHQEHNELEHVQCSRDLMAAIGWVSQLASLLGTEYYEELYGSEVRISARVEAGDEWGYLEERIDPRDDDDLHWYVRKGPYCEEDGGPAKGGDA